MRRSSCASISAAKPLVRLVSGTGTVLGAFGANPRHKRFRPLPEKPFFVDAEVAARRLLGQPNRDPRLLVAELAEVHFPTRALRRRIEVIRDTMAVLTDETLARALYETALSALVLLRFPTETREVGLRVARLDWAERIWERSFEPSDAPAAMGPEAEAAIGKALDSLDAGLATLRDRWPKQGRILTTGHAHIDYAWLWPQPETVRKILRTLHSANYLLKAHPEMTFLHSASITYAHVEEEDPDLFAEIRGHVAEGRWEVAGGMFIECDTNMPSAEAFVRQFLYGQRYFERTFQRLCRTAWLPDTFGFTSAMPQILRHAGLDAMVTIKVTWNETNTLPDNIFEWIGNDGSTVFVHTFDARANDGYNMQMTAAALAEVWANHRGADLSDVVISSYGWGDGGGGPDPDQIETMPVLNMMPALPQIEHGSIQAHLDRLRENLAGHPLPTWRGEIYLEYHRATLTSQARTKQLNRQAERALTGAEMMAGLAALAGIDASLPDLAADWKLTLRNQFHDILPGSSVREVYEQTEAELTGVVERAEASALATLRIVAGDGEAALAIANLSGSAKSTWQIASAEPLPETLGAQRTGSGWVVTGDRPLTPLSIARVDAGSTARVAVEGRSMENALVRVTLDAEGRIGSLFDKRAGRELMDGPGNRLMVYRNDLPREYDAWDIEPGFELGGEELGPPVSVEVTAEGPHLAEITVTRRFGASTIVQHMRLWSNSPRVEIVTDLDWHDRRTYLRAVFPVTVLAETAVFDQAIGVTHRATHDNTTWQKAQFEGCGHRFVSMSETDWGAAILSADKYGFSAKGNTLTLSLIRGPMYPDMLADEGRHRFTYAILPHDGCWWSAGVQAEADLVSDPLRFVHTAAGPALRPSGGRARICGSTR